jgi:hypothetical protein
MEARTELVAILRGSPLARLAPQDDGLQESSLTAIGISPRIAQTDRGAI